LRLATALQQSDARVAQTADVPSSRVSPNPVRDALLGALLGLILGTLVVMVIEVLDRRIKTLEDIEQALNVPLLATVPPVNLDALARGPVQPAVAESLQTLQLNLTFAGVDRDVRVIVVVSAEAAEGKTVTALGLAMTLAAMRRRVLLIDADFRNPSLSRTLGLTRERGLSNILADTKEFLPDLVTRFKVASGQLLDEESTTNRGRAPAASNGAGPTLEVLGSGPSPPNPGEVLSGRRFKGLLAIQRGRYDYIILDSAPLLPVSDTLPLLKLADGALIAARLYRTRSDRVRRMATLLARAGGFPLGVAVGVPRRAFGYGYGYGYGYGATYGSAPEDADDEPAPATPAASI